MGAPLGEQRRGLPHGAEGVRDVAQGGVRERPALAVADARVQGGFGPHGEGLAVGFTGVQEVGGGGGGGRGDVFLRGGHGGEGGGVLPCEADFGGGHGVCEADGEDEGFEDAEIGLLVFPGVGVGCGTGGADGGDGEEGGVGGEPEGGQGEVEVFGGHGLGGCGGLRYLLLRSACLMYDDFGGCERSNTRGTTKKEGGSYKNCNDNGC